MIASADTLDERPTPPPAPTPDVPDDASPDRADRSNGVAPHAESCDGVPTEPANERSALDGDPPAMFTKPLRELTLAEALTPAPGRLASLRPAAMMGGQFLPGAIACRATVRATITPIVHPGQAPPEPRYRPSKKLADFAVRADGGVEPKMSVPKTPLAEDVLGWRDGLAR